MEPVHYVRILRRRLKLILALTILGAVLGAASTLAASEDAGPPTQYLATHVLVDEGPADHPVNLDMAKYLATTTAVATRVADEIGGDPLELVTQVQIITNPSLRTLEILAVTPSPERSEAVANTFATELAAYLLEEDQNDVDTQVARLREQIQGLEAEFAAIVVDESLPEEEQELRAAQRQALAGEITEAERQLQALTNQVLPAENLSTLDAGPAIEVTFAQRAAIIASKTPKTGKGNQNNNNNNTDPALLAPTGETTGDSSLLDNPAVRAIIGGLLGFGLGVAVAVLINRFDPRLRTKEEAEDAFGLPVIAEIPALPRTEQDKTSILAFDAPRSPTAESYRALRSSLVFLGQGPGADQGHPGWTSPVLVEPVDHDTTAPRAARVIMVTSPGPGEGKTTSTANLVAVLAEAGFSVLAINCDFRKPRLHKYLRAQDTPRKVVETSIPGVRMICDVVADSRRLNPAEIVAAQRKVVEGARELFDIIVLDTAPILTTNDAIDLLPEADLVVVFCRAGRTTREAAQRTAELLERHGAPMAGCAIVGIDEGPSARYYYYYNEHEAPSRDEPVTRRNGSAGPTGNGKTNGNGTHTPADGGRATASTLPGERPGSTS
jgi:Mrp family chromosome partitioning ATPase/capsular polysaccharide biosynthesis protein